MHTLTHRKSLNEKQLDILRLLYRFRFGTTELFALALGVKNKHKMNERLKVLLDQEYIGRRYEASYRLAGKHATYYLASKGIKTLRSLGDKYDNSILHNLHKDKSASEQFIDHSLRIFRAYCHSRAESLLFFTKNQLTQFDYFPEPLPDAYIRIKNEKGEEQYFIEVLQSSRPFFVAARKVQKYIEYAENGDWDITETSLPAVILLCDNSTLAKRIEKLLNKLEVSIEDELKFYVGLNITETLEYAKSPAAT